jgi:internalin A
VKRALGLAFAVLALAACEEHGEKDLISRVVDANAMAPVDAAPAASASTASDSVDAAAPKKQISCPASDQIDFRGNAALEAEVRRKLAKDGGAITKSDLRTIKSINLSQAKVDELDPCIFPLFTGVKDLFLGAGDLEDLSPIANLTQLITLRASINHVSDLKPLSKMTQMDRLDIGRTAVHDIGPLANMQMLTELQLDDTQVVDLTPLSHCKKLEKVSIRNTPVVDISAFKGDKSLKFLYIEGAPVEDTNVLSSLVAGGLKIKRSGQM